MAKLFLNMLLYCCWKDPVLTQFWIFFDTHIASKGGNLKNLKNALWNLLNSSSYWSCWLHHKPFRSYNHIHKFMKWTNPCPAVISKTYWFDNSSSLWSMDNLVGLPPHYMHPCILKCIILRKYVHARIDA